MHKPMYAIADDQHAVGRSLSTADFPMSDTASAGSDPIIPTDRMSALGRKWPLAAFDAVSARQERAAVPMGPLSGAAPGWISLWLLSLCPSKEKVTRAKRESSCQRAAMTHPKGAGSGPFRTKRSAKASRLAPLPRSIGCWLLIFSNAAQIAALPVCMAPRSMSATHSAIAPMRCTPRRMDWVRHWRANASSRPGWRTAA